MSGWTIIAFRGDGRGKTTQANLLRDYLTQKDIPSLTVRDLDYSPIYEGFTHICGEGPLSSNTIETIHDLVEKEHLIKVILPAIREKKWIIYDSGSLPLPPTHDFRFGPVDDLEQNVNLNDSVEDLHKKVLQVVGI